jgi:hypothetical protein
MVSNNFCLFKCNLYRYAQSGTSHMIKLTDLKPARNVVGICTLNQVDTYPTAYNLSNP